VGINAQLLSGQTGYRRAGIHHYIAQLLAHLPTEAESGLRYVVYTGAESGAVNGPASRQLTRWPTERPMGRILWEQLAWPWLAWQQGIGLLHSLAFVLPIFRPCPALVTVYDLSFILYPERFPPLQRLYLRSQCRRSCRQARRIITIAESGRRDVARLFGLPLEKIDVVTPGVESHFRPLPEASVDSFRQRQGLPARFLLHVGTLQPRKNIPVLLQALARLGRPELLLVLVGGKGWGYAPIFAEVEALGLTEQVRYAGYVADEELPLWYNAATIVVFPSLYEGFGLPVAEAMACGRPVIAASSPAVAEVAGNAAQLFAPTEAAELADCLAALLDNPAEAAALADQGPAQASRFSWAESGDKMASIYRQELRGA
jgi:glycosyltransferase involved in cell wall biosynthesis